MLSLFVPARHSPEFVSGHLTLLHAQGCGGGACQLSKWSIMPAHCSCVTPSACSEVHLLHVQGLQHVNTVRWRCRFCWTTRIHQASTQMITGVLCSSPELCSCIAVLVAATCTGFVQDAHSQVHPYLPLARPDTRENAGKQPLIC
jgi:hypothetical protein